MDIAMLTGLFPKEYKQQILEDSIGVVQNAADSLQWKFVEGLDQNLGHPVKLINSLYIGSFPARYKKMRIKTASFSHTENAKDVNVGFLNLPLIKMYSRYRTLLPHLKKWALDGKKNKVLIGYALTSVFVEALRYVKKINPEVTTCIIVPDLPEYMNTSNKTSFAYSFLKGLEIKLIHSHLSYCDKFVLLTEQMAESLGVQDYVVVEGIASEQEIVTDKPEKIILYTGSLHEKYGILNLISAFELMENKEYKLVICGAGDSEKYIRAKAKDNADIIFRGQLPREEILELQKKAAILVNPRQGNEVFTKYSFPSKNLEYLSTGRAVVAYKLAGIPAEYDNYFFYVDGDSVVDFAHKLDEVCQMDPAERQVFGNRAANFVQTFKSAKAQCRRVLESLHSERQINE